MDYMGGQADQIDDQADAGDDQHSRRVDLGRMQEALICLAQDVEGDGKEQQGIERRQDFEPVVAIGPPDIGRAPGDADGG